jgi:hypothetical protein
MTVYWEIRYGNEANKNYYQNTKFELGILHLCIGSQKSLISW